MGQGVERWSHIGSFGFWRNDHAGRRDIEARANCGASARLASPPHRKYERLIARAKQVPAARTFVAHPCDETSLRGAIEAAEAGIIVPILVGPAAKIAGVAREHGLDIDRFEIVDAPHSDAAAAKAVALIHEGKGELLMKGSLHTDELMREVTSSKTGLRTARRISHVFIMDVPTYAETLFITDAAINIFPDLDAKRDIVQNAIDLFTQIGLGTPARRDSLGGRDRDPENSLDHRCGRVVQDGRPRPDHRRHARRSAGLRQRDRPRGGENQRDQSEVAGRAQILVVPGSRGRQHAGEEPGVPRQGRLGRHRAWRAGADHPDLARGFGAQRAWHPARSPCSMPTPAGAPRALPAA